VIPSIAALKAIFEAVRSPKRKDEHPGVVYRTLFKLIYYTAGRPESEPCQLRHGDIELPDHTKVRKMSGRRVLGRITFRNTKTGKDRTIPLHPEVEADLKAVMETRPDNPDELEEWARMPIFRKRGKSTPMDRSSYRKSWSVAIEKAIKQFPELKGMVPRDLRKTARTFMTNARVPEPTIRRIMGHSLDVSQGYHELTEEAAEQAILTLNLEKAYTKAYTRRDDHALSESA
jgi:hypothetical protein